MLTKKSGLILAAAAGMAFSATAVHAETFATMGAIPAKALTAPQMKAVEGRNHIYFLVDTKVEVSESVELVLRAAAPKPQNGGAGNSPNFARSPSRDAAAFNFLD